MKLFILEVRTIDTNTLKDYLIFETMSEANNKLDKLFKSFNVTDAFQKKLGLEIPLLNLYCRIIERTTEK